jgi:hypothetical protein
MDKQIIKQVIGEYQSKIRGVSLTERPMTFDGAANYVLVGVRRAGKSYLLYQDIKKQLKEGAIDPNGFLYINFEDERIADMSAMELNIFIDSYKEMYGDKEPLIYLDEIQNVDGWEKFARRLADQKYRVMITGSNAKMLSREIASTLGGRFIPRQVDPFSFSDFLHYKGIELNQGWEYDPTEKTVVYRAFEDYFYYGGFAEGFNMADQKEYLNSLYQKILMGDIVERNKIRNSRVFRLLGKKLAQSVMQPTALTRLRHIIESAGDRISLPVLKDYLEYMTDAYLIFGIPNLVSPLSDQETVKKRYFVDNGILNLFLFQGETQLLENLVAINLNRKFRNNDEELRLFYYSKNIEIDFVVPEIKMAYQVCYNIHKDQATYDRETGSLLSFLSAFPDYQGTIISYDDDETLEIKGKSIEVIPVWKWMCKEF